MAAEQLDMFFEKPQMLDSFSCPSNLRRNTDKLDSSAFNIGNFENESLLRGFCEEGEIFLPHNSSTSTNMVDELGMVPKEVAFTDK